MILCIKRRDAASGPIAKRPRFGTEAHARHSADRSHDYAGREGVGDGVERDGQRADTGLTEGHRAIAPAGDLRRLAQGHRKAEGKCSPWPIKTASA